MAAGPLTEPAFWQGRSVLLTGHTGFVGGWLALALCQLGARVTGFALPPEGDPNLFTLAAIDRDIHSIMGDLRDAHAVSAAVERAAPEVVFHLAAQPLVRAAHARPVETFEVNLLGTVHLLEALRRGGGPGAPGATVVMTTDKVYRDAESATPFREDDELGGSEPYSASKAAAEFAVAAYRRSYAPGGALATLRAGNILGGGDWGPDRIIPDAVRAFLKDETLVLRNPAAIRPWQHVNDVLAGALSLAEALWRDPQGIGTAWNFGPPLEQQCTVEELVRAFCDAWGGGTYRVEPRDDVPETAVLKLDSSRARDSLGWRRRYDLQSAIRETVAWYKAYGEGRDMAAHSRTALADFLTT